MLVRLLNRCIVHKQEETEKLMSHTSEKLFSCRIVPNVPIGLLKCWQSVAKIS
jgi:hypothetical protein